MEAFKDNSLATDAPQQELTPGASLLFKPTPTPTSRASPSRSPRRIYTDPSGDVMVKTHKRIIVCCDGTWQDGIAQDRSRYTNVLRLARSIVLEDVRLKPPIAQVVFYQSGIGSDENFYSRYVQGTTGSSLGDKIEQAYAFIAQNYNPGDEIFLFGFSRGAYTARMVAQFIGEIGVLDCRDMDSFAQIFSDYQTLGKTKDLKEKKVITSQLAPWRNSEAPGKKRVLADGRQFMIKFLGVWDTVGALGLPGPFREESKIFGFNDSLLGDHIERAYQALALNETRLDFICNKFHQTDAGRAKNQVVKQVWFTGSHSDIGGGYEHHDLADLTLFWMADEVRTFLSLDLSYLHALIQPVAPWGTQQPHNSRDGIFALTMDVKRPLPNQSNDPTTHEFVHESVVQDISCPLEVKALVDRYPQLVYPLGGFETAVRYHWSYDEKTDRVKEYLHDVKTRTVSNWLEKLIQLSKPRDLPDPTADTSTTTTTTVVVNQTAEITMSRNL